MLLAMGESWIQAPFQSTIGYLLESSHNLKTSEIKEVSSVNQWASPTWVNCGKQQSEPNQRNI